MAAVAELQKPTITPAEQEKRRASVRSAFRSNAMEGLAPNPHCQPVFDAYIAGEIDLNEMLPRIKSILGIQK